MLRTLILGLISLLIIFAGAVFVQPDEYTISVSQTINTPIDKAFEKVNNLEKFQEWSPWAKLDPNSKNIFEGPKEGVGAIFKWYGDSKIGAGKMEIVESVPYNNIKFKLDFLKPYESTSYTDFEFTLLNNKTQVTWVYRGTNNYSAKAVCLVLNCNKMITNQFQDGLDNLKKVLETKSKNYKRSK